MNSQGFIKSSFLERIFSKNTKNDCAVDVGKSWEHCKHRYSPFLWAQHLNTKLEEAVLIVQNKDYLKFHGHIRKF